MFQSKIARFNKYQVVTFLLIISDVLAAFFSFVFAYFLRDKGFFRFFLNEIQPLDIYLKVLPFAVGLFLCVNFLINLYDRRQRVSLFKESYGLFGSVVIWGLLIMAGSYLQKTDYSRLIVFQMIFYLGFFSIGGRWLIRLWQQQSSSGFGRINVAIIGTGRMTREIARRVRKYESVGYHLVGFIATGLSKKSRETIGNIRQLPRLVANYSLDEIFIADPSWSYEKVLDWLCRYDDLPVKFKVVSNVFDLVTGEVDIADLQTIPSIDVGKSVRTSWQRSTKRFVDIFGSIVLLLVTLPLFLLISIAIKLDSSGEIIFRQERTGYLGSRFLIYKFRTMFTNNGKYKIVRRNDSRITRVGRWLRKTSLDELPQLLNVIRGEMSLVGPRPELPQTVEKYSRWQRRRLLVKPGLTGLWQVLGRKDLPLTENLEYDFYYINNQSLALDLLILLKTIPQVLLGKGAY